MELKHIIKDENLDIYKKLKELYEKRILKL